MANNRKPYVRPEVHAIDMESISLMAGSPDVSRYGIDVPEAPEPQAMPDARRAASGGYNVWDDGLIDE